MAEYIDRNLIEWYGCDFEDGSCEHRECSECSQAECSHTQVMQIPVADVVEREKVNKAIEEIQKLRGCSCSCSDGIIDDVEDILDKLIAESEE